MKKTKKIALFALLAFALVATTAFGTMAWLTTSDTKVNEFIVGDVNKPTTNPDGTDNTSLNGHIVEPNFNPENNKLLPGGHYNKDPYVGIGKGSEPSYVYVYIDNDFYSSTYKDVYFTITDAWEPVENRTKAGKAEGTYAEGLFRYKTTLAPTADADAWTTKPLFEKVTVDSSTTIAELENGIQPGGKGRITVNAFIHQATDGDGADLAATALNDALAWADGLGQ